MIVHPCDELPPQSGSTKFSAHTMNNQLYWGGQDGYCCMLSGSSSFTLQAFTAQLVFFWVFNGTAAFWKSLTCDSGPNRLPLAVALLEVGVRGLQASFSLDFPVSQGPVPRLTSADKILSNSRETTLLEGHCVDYCLWAHLLAHSQLSTWYLLTLTLKLPIGVAKNWQTSKNGKAITAFQAGWFCGTNRGGGGGVGRVRSVY